MNNIHYGLEASFPTLLDNTQINNFRSCEEKAHLYSILKRTGSAINPHLNAGSAYADGMEAFRLSFYQDGKPEQEALGDGLVKAFRTYGMYEPPERRASEAAKTWDRVGASMISYVREYPPAHDHLRPAVFDGKVSTVFSFAVPLPIDHPDTGEPLLYGGVFDCIMRFGEKGIMQSNTPP